VEYKQKYLKYKQKYLDLKNHIGGKRGKRKATPLEIKEAWEAKGLKVTESSNQDGWFLHYSNEKNNGTHIHLYTDGSYTYKIHNDHQPSIADGDDCDYYTIDGWKDYDDGFGCRSFELNTARHQEAEYWVNFLYNEFRYRYDKYCRTYKAPNNWERDYRN